MRKRNLGLTCLLVACQFAAVSSLVATPARAESMVTTTPNKEALPEVTPDGDIVHVPTPVATGDTAIATNMSAESLARHDACIAKTGVDAKAAYEDALAWRAEGGGALALHCVARAQMSLGNYDLAAERLQSVATMREVTNPTMRAAFIIEAGHAFILANRLPEARKAFDSAVLMLPADPDLRIDRAETLMQLEEWQEAIADTNAALRARPTDVDALRIRGEARLALNDVNAAGADADAALEVDPTNVAALVLRGKVRELKAGRSIN